jgi:hypothetical protein
MEPYKLDRVTRLTAPDARNFAIERKKRYVDKETGETVETWVAESFYNDVSSALRAYARQLVRKSEKALPQALVDACDRLDEILADIKFVTRGL